MRTNNNATSNWDDGARNKDEREIERKKKHENKTGNGDSSDGGATIYFHGLLVFSSIHTRHTYSIIGGTLFSLVLLPFCHTLNAELLKISHDLFCCCCYSISMTSSKMNTRCKFFRSRWRRVWEWALARHRWKCYAKYRGRKNEKKRRQHYPASGAETCAVLLEIMRSSLLIAL